MIYSYDECINTFAANWIHGRYNCTLPWLWDHLHEEHRVICNGTRADNATCEYLSELIMQLKCCIVLGRFDNYAMKTLYALVVDVRRNQLGQCPRPWQHMSVNIIFMDAIE